MELFRENSERLSGVNNFPSKKKHTLKDVWQGSKHASVSSGVHSFRKYAKINISYTLMRVRITG